MADDPRHDNLIDPKNKRSSAAILEALNDSERQFRDYNELCRQIDQVYSARSTLATTAQTLGLTDQEYDTFWASMEVLKPAIYAKPPRVIVKPRYSDASPAAKVAAEMIERVVNSEFDRTGIDMQLREVRDDLALLNRGVLRVVYETKGGKRICVDHVDRLDYRHEPVRYWRELGWEAFGAWLTRTEMRERFEKSSANAFERATYISRKSQREDEGGADESLKCLVWEVWDKANNRVYWVTEGVDVLLDESEPYLDLSDFWPGPRPAYGTLRRRTLIPVPDYVRYVRHLDQINELTARIYGLLERVRVVGMFAGSGEQGKALETAIAEMEASAMFIPVPSGLVGNGGDLIQWLPLDVIANTITGLIEARNQLFADFDRLSGISDIMRGETEAQETLGAQRIKTQYGSVRVRDKTDEIVRLARDTARIAAEIICTNFDQKTLLDIAQMDIPTRAQVDKDIKALKDAARRENEALAQRAKEQADQALSQGQQVEPGQAEAMLKQAQQALAEKYAPEFQRLANTVVIEDVMKVIKDRRERGLTIDIETDSTVMVDEMAEKQARNELLQAFSAAIQSLLPLFQIGEPGVKLAITMLSFTLQPYTRGNRQIEQQLEELIEQAPEIAARMAQQQGGDGDKALAEANAKIAEAEIQKAQAATAKVQADTQLKTFELQQKQQTAEAQAIQDRERFALEIEQTRGTLTETNARVEKIWAEIQKINVDASNQTRQQDREDVKAVADIQARQTDQAMSVEGAATERAFRERGEARADRQQDFTERQGEQDNGR